MNTSDIIADRLIDWGVEVIFGLPGDGINGMMEALRNRSDKIKFVLVRHEEGAAFSAVGYAKFTGKLGVCLATSGPGGIHLLNGLYDAHMDNVPVLAITGRTYSDLIGSGYQQDVDLLGPFSAVAGFNHIIMNAEHAQMTVDLACKHATGNRGVAHISIPIDVQEEQFSKDRVSEHKVPKSTSNILPAAFLPDHPALEQAASILNSGKKVVLFVGAGALGAGEEVLALAQKLKAPVVKSLLGKAVVPDDDPVSLGGLGLLGTSAAEEAMENADTMLMVGTSYPFSDFLPKPGQVKAVQIDIRADRIGIRYPVSVGLVGDSKTTLRELNKLVRPNDYDSFLKEMQKKMSGWWELMAKRGSRTDFPLKPQVVAWTLSDLLTDDAIVVSDSGTITTWAARYIKIKKSQMFSLSGTLASMANGTSYAIGAQTAYPNRQVVAIVGDGGFTMLMGEFATAVRYNLPIKVIVVKNGALGMIRWEQIGFLGHPEYGVRFQDIDFVKFAEACGGVGYKIEKYEEVKPTLEKALQEKGPTIVEAVVDPNEPPYPARLELKQVENFAKALIRGEPNRKKIALTLYRDKIKEL
ncbi:MAG: thiamine pyrophosphate-dependent enzyme [Nitrososphaerales archaeon]